jgi:hypothetical protein
VRVEVTLKNGVTVVGHTTYFDVEVGPISKQIQGFSWSYKAKLAEPYLAFLRPEEVCAVVIYPESSDLKAGQDKRNGEAAEPGGDEVEPG